MKLAPYELGVANKQKQERAKKMHRDLSNIEKSSSFAFQLNILAFSERCEYKFPKRLFFKYHEQMSAQANCGKEVKEGKHSVPSALISHSALRSPVLPLLARS